jgi:hypothetical protein
MENVRSAGSVNGKPPSDWSGCTTLITVVIIIAVLASLICFGIRHFK